MEDKLIVAVCAHPVIYDPSSYEYRDRSKRDLAWRKISEEVGMPGEMCRKRWKTLRETYLKEVKKEKDRRKSGAVAGKGQKWKFQAVLSFLDPFITPRESTSNMGRVEDNQATGDDHRELEDAAAEQSCASETSAESPDPDDPDVSAAAAEELPGPPPAAALTGPQKKRARRRQQELEPSDFERQMLELLKARPAPSPSSEDEIFFQSLLPLLKKVPPQSKELVKFKIHKFLFENSSVTLNLEQLDPSE